MNEEWPEENSDLYNWLVLGFASGDNQVIQHDLVAQADGLLGAAPNVSNTNAAAADQGNGGGQTNGEQRARTRHVRRRHTAEQIMILEAAFEGCNHPDEKRRLDLSRRTALSAVQVQIWFQNRRNSGKSKAQKKETEEYQEENGRLQAEQQALLSAMQKKFCIPCRGEDTPERQRLYAENMRLKDEHKRIAAFLKSVSGGRLQVINHTVVDAGNASAATDHHALPPPFQHAPLTVTDPNPVMFPDEGIAGDDDHETNGKSLLFQHVACALEELKMLVGLDAPLWSTAQGGEVEVINYREYLETMFPGMYERYEMDFCADATRKTGIISCTATDIVGILMDADWWSQTFSGIVASATTSKVITPGDSSGHGLAQLMSAELRVLSPRVPVRKINFIRHCQRLEENTWAVVDVSVDGILEQDGGQAAALNDGAPSTYTACKLLPSGCHIQELKHGYCQVTWVVNMVHDEATVPLLHHPLFRSGWALGACRWLASLQRRCEYIAFLHSNSNPTRTLNNRVAITPEGRRSVLEAAHRMTMRFYKAICGPGALAWRSVDEWRGSCGIGAERFDVVVRVVTFTVGRDATVLRATTTVWLPGAPPQLVFDYLCDGDRRAEWDIVANGAPILQEGYFGTGQLHGNSVSLLRTIASNGTTTKLILQESSIDASCMVLAYAPIDEQSMKDVLNGTRTSFSLLPSGVVVLPDGHAEPGGPPNSAMCSSSSSTGHKSNSGSLVSIMYQTLLSGQPPERLSEAVTENVGNLLCQAIDKIKSAVHADVVLAA